MRRRADGLPQAMPEYRCEQAQTPASYSVRQRIFSGALHYFQRLGRWAIVLWQVRGVGWADQIVLLKSAAVAPFIALRKLMEWQDPLLLSDCVVSVVGIGRFRVRGRTDDLWHVLPWRERSIRARLVAMLRPGDVFIDAGANIGVYTVIAARLVGPAGRVIAVEMMPDTASRLEENILINGLNNVTVVRQALSDVAGKSVTATVEPGKHGQASIAAVSQEPKSGSATVTTTTLDIIAADVNHVRLVKLDLEGVELQALQGAGDLLRRSDEVVFESLPENRDVEISIEALFRAAGFELRALDGGNRVASRFE